MAKVEVDAPDGAQIDFRVTIPNTLREVDDRLKKKLARKSAKRLPKGSLPSALILIKSAFTDEATGTDSTGGWWDTEFTRTMPAKDACAAYWRIKKLDHFELTHLLLQQIERVRSNCPIESDKYGQLFDTLEPVVFENYPEEYQELFATFANSEGD